MYWPRGRVWGGSSSLNAMVYVRSVYRCTVYSVYMCTIDATASLVVSSSSISGTFGVSQLFAVKLMMDVNISNEFSNVNRESFRIFIY